jgi:parallel beta-helix repeat protein
MKMKSVVLILIFPFIIPALAAECGTHPTDGCEITEDTIFAEGIYDLPNGVRINKSNITLDCNSATINGSSIRNTNGIDLRNVDNVVIKNCIIRNYWRGIMLLNSDGSFIQMNEIKENGMGIDLKSSNSNLIQKNLLLDNRWQGVRLRSSPENSILENKFGGNDIGVSLIFSDSNNLTGNSIKNNKRAGIFLLTSDGNLIVSNEIRNAKIGFRIELSNRNKILCNSICQNEEDLSLVSGENRFSENQCNGCRFSCEEELKCTFELPITPAPVLTVTPTPTPTPTPAVPGYEILIGIMILIVCIYLLRR